MVLPVELVQLAIVGFIQVMVELVRSIGQAVTIFAAELLDVDSTFDLQCFGVVAFTGVDMPKDRLHHLA